MTQEVVAAAGNANDQNPNEKGTAVQDRHLVSTAKIGPEAMPNPTKMASTGRFGQIVMAVAGGLQTSGARFAFPVMPILQDPFPKLGT